MLYGGWSRGHKLEIQHLTSSPLDLKPWPRHPLKSPREPNEYNGTLQPWTSKVNHNWSNLCRLSVWLLGKMMTQLPDSILGNITAEQTFWRWESIPMPLPSYPSEHPPKDNRIGSSFALIERSNHNTSTHLRP